jgi:hypothetical protein
MIIALSTLVLSHGAAAGGLADDDFRRFLELFEGQFTNQAQAAAEAGKTGGTAVPEPQRHPWHYHTVQRTSAPELGEHVFFARINEEQPDGPLVRERVFVIEPGPAGDTIVQHFFAVEAGAIDPETAAITDPASLRAYPEGCEVVWRPHGDGFSGEIAKGACRVVSPRSGRVLVIAAHMELDRGGMRHLEEGFDENLEPVFTAPGNRPFDLVRVAADPSP